MNEDYVFQLTEKIMVKVTVDLLLQGTLLKKMGCLYNTIN